mmetsp:Transcript_24736/g.51761  ORF Transcript_24736/g.51761 Transcript_24736/m.51761 type:complete len:273 (+) Transcript_24736:67-885(+)
MDHFAQRSLSLLLLVIALASSNAFLAPGIQQNLVAYPITKVAAVLPINTALHQSSSSDSDKDDASSTINIAYITTTDDNQHLEELQTMIKKHPFCKMMSSVQLAISVVPATSSPSWSKEAFASLQNADIACFGTTSDVISYLQKLDNDHFNVAEDISDEDRRKLPNKPDLVGDILGTATEGGVVFMAACPNVEAARECLNSGRWTNNHIYYPKETQGVVQLKTEPLEGQDGGEGEGSGEDELEEEIDVGVWAEAVVQAAGDVMERKFWGGGW